MMLVTTAAGAAASTGLTSHLHLLLPPPPPPHIKFGSLVTAGDIVALAAARINASIVCRLSGLMEALQSRSGLLDK